MLQNHYAADRAVPARHYMHTFSRNLERFEMYRGREPRGLSLDTHFYLSNRNGKDLDRKTLNFV